MNLQGKKIIFLGDSITQGVGASCEEARYTSLLQKRAGLAAIGNFGISGTRIARQQTMRPEFSCCDTAAFTERFDKMDEDADIVVVFGGTNDYGHGDAPFTDGEDQTIDTFCGALHCLMKGLIERYPTAVICFLTPLHREKDRQPNTSNQLPLKTYVDKIKETAQLYSLPVLDLFATAGIQPDIQVQKEMYCPDGVHPNDRGNERIAERLQAFLEAL